MRVFIAIELPKKIKEYLSSLQQELKITGADIKWVEPANMHITIKFIGQADERKIPEIVMSLEETAKNQSLFTAAINAIGAYPTINSPRVLWAGIGQGDMEIIRIASKLEESIVKIGIPKETRQFSSHITIGRSRSSRKIAELTMALNKAAGLSQNGLEFIVSSLTLFKSTLSPKGPTYEALKVANFRTN